MSKRKPMTPQFERALERSWELRREAIRLLDLIVAEFKSDPMAVQCFDLGTVRRSIEVIEELKALKEKYGPLIGVYE